MMHITYTARMENVLSITLAASGSPGFAAIRALIIAFGIGGLVALVLFLIQLARKPSPGQGPTVLRCQCGYDLRGTIKAKKDNCPECGSAIVE